MRIAIVIALVGAFIMIAVATSLEGAVTILVGWIPFLGRVIPEVKPDGPSVLVGALALLLFSAGVHWVGRSLHRSANPDGTWRFRWTAAVVLGVILLFTAGIAMIGITHQAAWLATSEQPLRGEGLARNGFAQNELKMIGSGMHNYASACDRFPLGGTVSAGGEPLHSWETQLLPIIGYSTYGIDMTRPWHAPENQKYFKCVLPEFINPEYRTPPLEDANGYGLSHYAANSRVMSLNKATPLGEFKKGTSNTILVGEVNAGFKPWGHPINWRDPATGLNGGANSFGGPTKTGTTFLMADGSVRFIDRDVDPAVLRALSDPRE